MTGTASLWATFELSFEGPSGGNPFRDVTLRATFTQGERTVRVAGFYDGDGRYLVRFLPDTQGQWRYQTSSNVSALDARYSPGASTLSCSTKPSLTSIE